jgi:hypothetical protein
MPIGSRQRARHDRAVWETSDPHGRRVALRVRDWLHIVETHAELDVEPEVILEIVRDPDHRTPGRTEDEVWFYGAGAGPSRWIKVVVHYEHGRGQIATAFPRRTFP